MHYTELQRFDSEHNKILFKLRINCKIENPQSFLKKLGLKHVYIAYFYSKPNSNITLIRVINAKRKNTSRTT